jgi:hypothetical protein
VLRLCRRTTACVATRATPCATPGVATEQCVTGRLERLLQQRAGLRIQAAAEDVHAVVIDVERQVPRLVSLAFGVPFLQTIDTPPRAHDPLDLCSRAAARDIEQLRFVLRRRYTRDRTHLRKRQLTLPHRLTYARQRAQCSRRPDPLASCARRNAGAPAQPVRAAPETAAPPFPLVEVGKQRQQRVRRRVDVRCERRDLITDPVQLGGIRPSV